MKNILNIALLTFIILSLLLSCGVNSNPKDKEYIKSLEEKNAKLLQEAEVNRDELNNIKEKNSLLQRELNEEIDAQLDDQNTKKADRNMRNNSKDYFTIGSTEKEVLRVMGDPTSITKYSMMKIYKYGLSSVTFEHGIITEYDNYSGNLKIKIKNAEMSLEDKLQAQADNLRVAPESSK